jgi:hypothetical protein
LAINAIAIAIAIAIATGVARFLRHFYFYRLPFTNKPFRNYLPLATEY